ncbi:MAG: hypothetical protein PHE79_01585 [Eubacteriales bacterium]|nr:hypothetical protein [Eubacteriales bacterium]
MSSSNEDSGSVHYYKLGDLTKGREEYWRQCLLEWAEVEEKNAVEGELGIEKQRYNFTDNMR